MPLALCLAVALGAPLVAPDCVGPWQWNDPEFLEGLRDRATKLTLGEGDVERVTLTLRK